MTSAALQSRSSHKDKGFHTNSMEAVYVLATGCVWIENKLKLSSARCILRHLPFSIVQNGYVKAHTFIDFVAIEEYNMIRVYERIIS